jgi:hypothetical protein
MTFATSLHRRLASVGIAAACALCAPALTLAQSSHVTPASAQAGDTAASHVRAAERLLEAANVKELLSEQSEQMLQAQLKTNPQLGPYADILRDFTQKYAGYDALKPDLVNAYTTSFSEPELDRLTAFYQTELGKMVMQRLPKVMASIQVSAVARTQAAMPELMAAIQKRMAEQGAQPQ